MERETEAALLWSTPRLRPAELVRLRELLYQRLDWTRVVGILGVHRTMGVAWRNVLDHLIAERGKLQPSYLFKTLEVTYKGQLIMAGEQIDYSVELLDALDAEGIPCAMLKGGAVTTMAYPSPGMRVFNDNDVLVEHRRLAEVSRVLAELGYLQGSWNYAEGAVLPARRRDIMLYPVSSHQTHPFMRPTPAARTLECHRVDLHFSVDLLTANRTDDVVRELLSRRVKVGEAGMWALDPVDMLVFGCVHFFKEAVYFNEVARLKDLVLYKLVDLVALLDAPDHPVAPDDVVARALAMGVGEQVYHALRHASVLFPGRVPDQLLGALCPASEDYLDEVTDDDGRVYRWTAPIEERFFDGLRFADLGRQAPPPFGTR